MGWSWQDEQGTPLDVLEMVATLIHEERDEMERARARRGGSQ